MKKILLISIALLLGLNNILIGYKIFGISVDRLLELFIFIYLIKFFIFNIKKNYHFNLVFRIILLLIIFKLFNFFSIILQNGDVTFLELTREITRPIFMFIFFSLAYYLFQKDEKYIKYTFVVYMLAFTLAFFQNYLTPYTREALEIKLLFFANNMQGEFAEKFLSTANSSSFNLDNYLGRITGPYGQTITLTYSLITAALLLAYYYYKTKKIAYYFMYLFVMIIGILSLTKSVIIPTILLFILISFFNIKLSKKIFTFLILLLISVFLSVFTLNNNYFERIFDFSDQSSSGRFPLAITGLVALLKYPLGITDDNYYKVKEEMFLIFHHKNILYNDAHNGFINFGFNYTLLGYFILFYFIFKIAKSVNRHLTKKDKIFWFLLFLFYSIHQSFHNTAFLVDDFNIMILLALLVNKLDNSQKRLENT